MEYWNKNNFFLLTGTPGSEVIIHGIIGVHSPPKNF